MTSLSTNSARSWIRFIEGVVENGHCLSARDISEDVSISTKGLWPRLANEMLPNTAKAKSYFDASEKLSAFNESLMKCRPMNTPEARIYDIQDHYYNPKGETIDMRVVLPAQPINYINFDPTLDGMLLRHGH